MNENEVTVSKHKGKTPTPITLPAGDFTLQDIVNTCNLKKASVYIRMKNLLKTGAIEVAGSRPTGGVGRPNMVFRQRVGA